MNLKLVKGSQSWSDVLFFTCICYKLSVCRSSKGDLAYSNKKHIAVVGGDYYKSKRYCFKIAFKEKGLNFDSILLLGIITQICNDGSNTVTSISMSIRRSR